MPVSWQAIWGRATPIIFVGGRLVVSALKVLVVTIGSIAAVLLASLIISIVQFQARLSDARAQNASISYESIQLIADYQSEIYQLYREVRAKSEQLGPLRQSYFAQYKKLTDQVVSLCGALDSSNYQTCVNDMMGNFTKNDSDLDATIAKYKKGGNDTKIERFIVNVSSDLKKISLDGAYLKLQAEYLALQNSVSSQCTSLTSYVSDQLPGASLLAVSAELRTTVTIQCRISGVVDNVPTNAGSGQSSPTQSQMRQPERTQNETAGVNRLLLSELVFYYKFYHELMRGPVSRLGPLILAPPEFVLIILVISTGVLGSFLFHTYAMFSSGIAGPYPSFAAIFLRATLGVMCALVIFILMRTGFVAVAENQGHSGANALSPFVVAFVSVAAGLLAEPAMARIKEAGTALISSSGGSASGTSGKGN